MKISDTDFLNFLLRYQNIKQYELSKGFQYFFKLLSAPNPTPRMQYSIEFYSDGWEKTHTCPAKLSMEFLDNFNSGLKDRSDYRNKTGAKTLSRRGGYLLQVLKDLEDKLLNDHKTIYTKLLEIAGEGYSLGEHSNAGTYIDFPGNGFNRICLYENEKVPKNTFSLEIVAGDTCTQARKLFKHLSYAKIIDLKKSGWSVESNFHFAWQRKNILFTRSDKSLAISKYIDYWRWALDKGYIRQYNKNEFDLLLKEMRNANIMNNRDIENFTEYFRTHNYQSAITCPAIINRINYPKERLNEDVENLAAQLKEKIIAIHRVYSQNYVSTSKS
jgi:hypothetical protein